MVFECRNGSSGTLLQHAEYQDNFSLVNRLLTAKTAPQLLRPNERYGTGFEKPQSPRQITNTITSADLVELDSWFTFHTLRLDPEFLTDEFEDWTELASFQISVVSVKVNDCV